MSNPGTSSSEMTLSMITYGRGGEKEDARGVGLSNKTVVANMRYNANRSKVVLLD